MKNRLIIAFIALMGTATAAFAQARVGSLFINEVMVQNDSNFVDDFGTRSGCIELFNAKHAPLEVSSVYITTDPANPTMYAIPLGDVNTNMPKRQHLLFWADGLPSRGTFHTSFVLNPDEPNWIGIYDSDKITLIDSITVPVLGSNQSYARKMDGEGVGREAWEVRDDNTVDANGVLLKPVTPSSNNVIRDSNDKIEKFAQKDANGFAMTIMAMCIVFSALLLLCLCFLAISKIGAKISKRNKMEAHGMDIKEVAKADRPDHDSGEEIAAIVMALHQHLNAHDTESTVLTINKVKRAYSPWNSNFYRLRELPRR